MHHTQHGQRGPYSPKKALDDLWAFYRYTIMTTRDLPEPWRIKGLQALRELERFMKPKLVHVSSDRRTDIVSLER